MKKVFVFLALLILSKTSFSFELHPDSGCELQVSYNHYDLCYSQEHRQALWTFHFLSADYIKGRQKRTNNFKADYQHIEDPVGHRDYKGSGFDRGHLVPAGDMKLNRESMSETFYMTNMSPQRSGFNSGVWRALEEGMRKEVLKHGSAYIITAPVLLNEQNYRRIRSGVSIPDYYYKIAFFPDKGFMLAFLIPNQSQRGKKFWEFRVSVNEIENLTGFDFFPSLPDDYEEELESSN